MLDPEKFNAFASIYNKSRIERFQIDSLGKFIKEAESKHDPVKMEEIISVIWKERKQGKTQKEISEKVGLSVSAVQYHLKNIRNKIVPKNESKTRFRGEKLERLKDFLIELKRDGRTTQEMAQICKISKIMVETHIKNRELQNQQQQKYKCNIQNLKIMTVKELKEKLVILDENMEVFIFQTNDEHPCSYVESVEVKEMEFYDDSEPMGKEKVLIIADH